MSLRWFRLLVALLIVAAAYAIRVLFFSSLERGIPYLTYYPAVMLAALFGGLFSGFLATALSASLSYFVNQKGYLSPVEWLAMAVFLVSCTMISFICEAMRRAQEKAKIAREQAETANRAKSVFLANMSHELRTPLNAVLGFSKLMQDDTGVSAPQRRMLEIINRSGEHLLNLINNVLDMAKVESGRTALEETAFDLHAMAREITDLISQRAEAKGLLLTLDVAPGLPQVITADEDKLRQAVINLVGNAVKFTLHGSVKIRFTGKQIKEGGCETLIIEVEDTGKGIAEEDRQRIFEPFVQLGHKSDLKGSGLGLTITRQFVELMGGTISVESVLNAGTTFRIEVPVKKSETSVAPAKVQEMGMARLAPGQPEYRILIVEDQEENWQLLQKMLERTGLPVRVAVNGAEGVEMFKSWRPHFIWMDWRMPIMDGLEATTRIRALDGGLEVKIAVLSASVFKEERKQVLTAGADDFVPKPIQFNRIYECMTNHLGVRFISNEQPYLKATCPSGELDRMALAQLPLSLRAELADALVHLDAERITGQIRRTAELNPALGGILEYYACQLKYTIILQALQANEKPALNETSAL